MSSSISGRSSDFEIKGTRMGGEGPEKGKSFFQVEGPGNTSHRVEIAAEGRLGKLGHFLGWLTGSQHVLRVQEEGQEKPTKIWVVSDSSKQLLREHGLDEGQAGLGKAVATILAGIKKTPPPLSQLFRSESTPSLESFSIVETTTKAPPPKPFIPNPYRLKEFGLSPIPTEGLRPKSGAAPVSDQRTLMRRLVEANAENPIKLPKKILPEETDFINAYLDERMWYISDSLWDLTRNNPPENAEKNFRAIRLSKAEVDKYFHSILKNFKRFIPSQGDTKGLSSEVRIEPDQWFCQRLFEVLSKTIQFATVEQLNSLKKGLKEFVPEVKKNIPEKYQAMILEQVQSLRRRIDDLIELLKKAR